jgi:hypothetical protein
VQSILFQPLSDLVAFCFDGAQLKMPMSAKLLELKEAISNTDTLSYCPTKHQRLFFFGREFKTGGRTLSSLGLDRFKPHYVLQMHSSQPNVISLPDGEDKNPNSRKRRKKGTEHTTTTGIRVRRPKRERTNNVLNNSNSQQALARNTTAATDSVIDLGDSDDEVEAVAVVNIQGPTRSTKPVELV